MRILYADHASETVLFAARELDRYLKRMLIKPPENGEICLRCDQDAFDGDKRDCFLVRITAAGGSITGNNDRSVLLGVYDYLHELGCRFLMPGQKGEIVPSIEPEKLPADYEKRASCFHRGVCIEGADSFENIMDYIDWLPKVGYNTFFLQFKTPYAFLSRWYIHQENPFAKAEPYTPEDALRDMERLEREIKRRGLLLHKAGHGWTGEVLGYQTVSWDTQEELPPGKYQCRMAEVHGERKLFMGIPADTNLCYANREAVSTFAGLVTDYARENKHIDYLHVWLADEYNNVCECDACQRTTLSDQYVELLNEIDRRLTAEGLDTKLVFLLYQELLWPPRKSRLANPERFVLMFAPISRTFKNSYEMGDTAKEMPVYDRNHITLPADLAENMSFLRGWQRIFGGDSFDYDYPLGRAHYGDFGYVHMAEIIYSDIQKLQGMGLDGYISCQELRAAFPNAFPNYVMGRTLFQKETPLTKLKEEYFSACYGKDWSRVLEYLSELSRLSSPDYVNGKGERQSQKTAGNMKKIRSCCLAFAQETAHHRKEDGAWDSIYWKVLEYHRRYVLLMAEALRALAEGRTEDAERGWEAMREYICRNETEYQPFLDVYRVLEVTQKYTGLHRRSGG